MLTCLDVIEALYQMYDGALAASTLPHQCGDSACGYREVEACENSHVRPGGVRKCHILELQAAMRRARRAVAVRDARVYQRLAVDHCTHACLVGEPLPRVVPVGPIQSTVEIRYGM